MARYTTNEQPLFEPHLDRSIYSVKIQLNQIGIDYTGGGLNFVRYNCSIEDMEKGWLIMYPGLITHYYQALKITRGMSYVVESYLED